MAKKTTVVLIEENDRLRESIKANLELNGLNVYTANNHVSGLDAVITHAPQFVLLDVSEGAEQFCSDMVLNHKTSHIPIIAFIEGDSSAAQKQIAKIHADNYITKPFADENIAEIVMLKYENSKIVKGKAQHVKKTPILVIDDEVDIRTLVKYNLSKEGFQVYTAEDGPSGIKAARKYKPKLILLDVMMPGMDGLEVLMDLKWKKKTEHIPVFMLTAMSTTGDMDNAFDNKADGYIIKPFDGDKLGETINRKLRELKKTKCV